MGMLPIDNLEIGMVLANDVFDRTGRLLLGAGSELTPKHLTIFRTWGIVEADIAGIEHVAEEPPLPAEVDPAALAAAEQELLPLFCHAGIDHPALRELLRLAAIRKVRHGLC